MRKVISIRHRPSKQTCALFTTDEAGRAPSVASIEPSMIRNYFQYIESFPLLASDFEIFERDEMTVGKAG